MHLVFDDTSLDAFAERIAPRIADLVGSASMDRRTAAAHHPDPEAYLSQAELLDTYGISKATAQRWRDAGLAYCKVGNLLFYRRADVRAWIERHRVRSSQAA